MYTINKIVFFLCKFVIIFNLFHLSVVPISYLITILMTPLIAVETFPNVKLNFEHKLLSADLEKGHLTFLW